MSENLSKNLEDIVVPEQCPLTHPPPLLPKLIASPSKIHETFPTTQSIPYTSPLRISTTLPKLMQSPQVVLAKMDDLELDTTPVKKTKPSSLSPDINQPLPPPPPLVKMPMSTRKGKRAAVTRAKAKATIKLESSVEEDRSPSQEPPRKRTRRDKNSEEEGRAPSRKIIQEIFGPDKSKRPKGKGRKRRKGPPTPKKKQPVQNKVQLQEVESKNAIEVEEEETEDVVEDIADDIDKAYHELDKEEEYVDLAESPEDQSAAVDDDNQDEIVDDEFATENVDDEAIETGDDSQEDQEEVIEDISETGEDGQVESGGDFGEECFDGGTCENVEQDEPDYEDEESVELDTKQDEESEHLEENKVEERRPMEVENVSDEELADQSEEEVREFSIFNPVDISDDDEDDPELVRAFTRGRRAAKQLANEKLKKINLQTELGQEENACANESDEVEEEESDDKDEENSGEGGPGLILRRRSTSATEDGSISIKSFSIKRSDSAYSEDITNLPNIDRYRKNYTPSFTSEEDEDGDAKDENEQNLETNLQDQKDSDVDSINSWKPIPAPVIESGANNYPPPGSLSVEMDSKTVAAAERRARKVYRYKGRSRRSLLFKSSSSKKFTTASNSNRYSAQTTILPKVFHNGYFFQPGDVIFVESNEDTPFYGHIRGILLDPFGEISAGIRWLFPKCTEYILDDFHPFNYTYRQDVPENLIKISHVNFVMHLSLDAFDGHYSFNKKERNAFYSRVGKQIYDYCLSSSSDEDSEDDSSSESSEENGSKNESVGETCNDQENPDNKEEHEGENNSALINQTEDAGESTDSTDVGEESDSEIENMNEEADQQQNEKYEEDQILIEQSLQNDEESAPPTPEVNDIDDKMEIEDENAQPNDENDEINTDRLS